MKILVFNWQDLRNPHAGGAEVHLHEIFSRIASRGHQVTLFCSSFPGAKREEVIDGIHVIREGSRNLFNASVPLMYRSRFRNEVFDVVIDDMNKIPFFTPLFVREPLFGIAHHLFGNSIFRETNPVFGAYVYVSERLALRVYRSRRVPFFVVSPSTREEFVRAGFSPHLIEIVHNCVDHAKYHPTGVLRNAVPLVGSFGRLKRYKCVDHLLAALPLVRREQPDVQAVIIGEGDDRPRLEELSRSLGIDGCVRFTGYVSEEEKVEWLQKIWCGVATSSKEGWGLTVVEANACGTPVVASDVPGLRDAVREGETGLLYPYGDIPMLARQIVRVLREEDLRRRLTQGALAWAGSFSWETSADRLLEGIVRRVPALRDRYRLSSPPL